MSCCVAMLMGAMPRLFMAVAQALGPDMGIGMALDSMVMFRITSGREERKDKKKSKRAELVLRQFDLFIL